MSKLARGPGGEQTAQAFSARRGLPVVTICPQGHRDEAGYEPDGEVEESPHTPGLVHVSLRKRL